MSKTLFSLFKNYHSQLSRLEVNIVTKQDLIAVEEAVVKSMFAQKVLILLIMFSLNNHRISGDSK
jgi:hypothetical protein